MTQRWFLAASMIAVLFFPWASQAQTLLHVDASQAPATVTHGYLHMGTQRARDGKRIGINSRYLTLDGKPWLPVMGEFHYVRVPQADWRSELLKMKSAGVSIVSTYVFWNYQEGTAGHFNWSGDRNLRRFVQLCHELGLYVMVRIGLWDHAETRFGGLPDWVVRSMPTRRNDSTYLHYVDIYYRQIARQLRGLWWKDDGPVIGVQIANEYNLRGPGQGRAHIARLKKIARDAGMDVPLYTVTGWDDTVFPHHAVAPVFGGYPDEPWSTSTHALPPRSLYEFRLHSRVSGGDLGAQTKAHGAGDANAVAKYTPFLGAEFGGGVPAMYRRRVVIAPDDVAAMLPVELGSGVNLYGYYMFQGGRNLIGGTTLEESTRNGGYNDVPIISYGFQAPLGQYGQERPVLGRLRPFHYFLQAFGTRLAPMTVHAPAKQPASAADLTTPRFAVRSRGESGFVFLNNHVRQYTMAAQKQVRFSIRLPHGTLTFPDIPVDIPSNDYFIWPFNFALDGAHLRWATAQPMTRLRTAHGVTYVFAATRGVKPRFAFNQGTKVISSSGTVQRAGDVTRVSLAPGSDACIELHGADGKTVRVLVLSAKQSHQAWLQHHDGRTRLVLTPDTLFFDGAQMKLRRVGDTHFAFEVYPRPTQTPAADVHVRATAHDGVFARYVATVRARHPKASVKLLRKGSKVPPVRIGGAAHAAMQPVPETWGDAKAWSISIPANALQGLHNVFLNIRYQGDMGRLFAGVRMLDDNFYNGQVWQIGLRRFAGKLQQPLMLDVLPLRCDAPIYIQKPHWPAACHDDASQVARLQSVSLVPEYALDVHFHADGTQ